MDNQGVLLTQHEINKVQSLLPDSLPSSSLLKENSQNSVRVSMVFTSSEASPKAEIHDNFNDIFIVQSGKEEFWVGGEIEDKEEIEKGEWLGQNLVGATRHQLEAGDVLAVPKGVPHKHGVGLATILVIKTA